MTTHVLLTKLSPTSMRDLKHRENLGREWFATVKEKCPEVNWVAHYALMGPYDFMDIFEAPDAETAMKVAAITTSKGAVRAETWNALPYREFLGIAKELTE